MPMAQVRLIARAVAKQGKQDELRKVLQRMLAPTHAEQGNVFYELFESHEGGSFFFNELWQSQQALDQHAASPHFKKLKEEIRELLAEPFEINLLTEIHE
jgi:quinol monooxygenase YgiN